MSDLDVTAHAAQGTPSAPGRPCGCQEPPGPAEGHTAADPPTLVDVYALLVDVSARLAAVEASAGTLAAFAAQLGPVAQQLAGGGILGALLRRT